MSNVFIGVHFLESQLKSKADKRVCGYCDKPLPRTRIYFCDASCSSSYMKENKDGMILDAIEAITE